MKNLLIILSTFTIALNAQNYTVPSIPDSSDYGTVFYIDYDQVSNGTGTKADPFNSWPNATKQNNTAYLFKAGNQFSAQFIINGMSNIYIGKYGGQAGFNDNPEITYNSTTFDFDNSHDIVIDSLIVYRQSGSSYGKIFDIYGSTCYNITIANCKVYGVDIGSGYPYRFQEGMCDGYTLYHCEIAYSRNDGMYVGGGDNVKIVSNYFHHQNMDNLPPISDGTGDNIQFENAQGNNLYIANNFLDREHTIWKFCLIINAATSSSMPDAIIEWNTFVSPLMGRGGAAVRWYIGSTRTSFRKNLINTNDGIPGIDGWGTHLNQPAPYGVRDNIEFGPGDICNQSLDDPTNLDFASEAAYLSFMSTTYADSATYGSDIDTANFWSTSGAPAYNPCTANPIAIVLDSIGADTIGRSPSTGYIYTHLIGGNGTLYPSWSPGNGENDDTTGLASGQYIETVIDDSSCSNYRIFNIIAVDTSSTDSTLIVDTVYSNLEDGENIDDNMLDGDFNTRWSNNLDTARAYFEFDKAYTIKSFSIATYLGNQRKADIALFGSKDGENWTQIFHDSTSGDTLGFEWYNITNFNGKYIKLEGYGNNMPSSEDWTSITEMRFFGDTSFTCDMMLSYNIINESDGDGSGAIDITVINGNGSLSYLWSPGNETTQDISSLNYGEYSVTVTDDSSCIAEETMKVYNSIAGNDTIAMVDTFEFFSTNDLLTDSTKYTSLNQELAVKTDGSNNYVTGNASGYNMVYFDTTESTNMDIQATLLLRAGSSWQGLIAVIDDTSAYIYMGKQYNSGLFYWTLNTGFSSNLGSDGGSYREDSAEYKLEVRGDTLRMYENGILDNVGTSGSGQYIATGKTFKYVGLMAQNSGGGKWDSLYITIYGGNILYPIDYTSTVVNQTCYKDSTASIAITSIFNGIAPYTHSWNIDSITSSITGLWAGTYSDTMRDAVDSQIIATFVIPEIDTIYYQIHQDDPINDLDNGQLRVYNISGGSGSYSILWNDSSTALTLETIPPGNYWFIITDGNGCKTDTVKLTLSSQTCPTLSLSNSVVDDKSYRRTGQITLSTTNGTSPYYYYWDDGATNDTRTGLRPAEYGVTVIDDNGCEETDTITVNNIKLPYNMKVDGTSFKTIPYNSVKYKIKF